MNDDRITRINIRSPEKRALVLEALTEGAPETQESRIGRRSADDEPIPLSLAQLQRLCVLDQLQPVKAYNECSAIRMVGPLDVRVLEQSLNEIVCRHEALRTMFPTVDGETVQVIAPARAVGLPVVDLSKLAKHARDAEVQRLSDEQTNYSFDLARGPLLRMNLLRLADEESILLVGAHHIVVDGWSLDIFRRELVELYKAFSAGQRSPLAELPVQYADFAIWQRQRLRKDDLGADLQYWTRQLSNLPPPLQLPVANRRPERDTFRGARQHFKVSGNFTADLKALSRRENVTLFMTLLGGLQILLHRYSNESDLPIGTLVANRNHPDIENLIGFFANTLVMRGDLSGNPSVRALLQRVRRIAIEAYDHGELPFDSIVKALQPERSSSYNPLVQVIFNLENTPKQTLECRQLTLSTLDIGSVTAKFDLVLSMEETPEGLEGYWQYRSDLFEVDVIRRMSGHFETLLKAMVANPDQAIATLPILTTVERRQMLVEWNRTEAVCPQHKCIHHLFETQAARTPDSIAVAYSDQTITYRELNRRANQLAHHLLSLGVGAETLVGIFMPRSVDIIVALLAVLKAGGAYVPLDPTDPPERRAHILADANPTALLTQQHLASALPAGSAQVICMRAQWQHGADDGVHNPIASVTPDNLAYVIYTSGTTGNPKGVLVSHRNLVHSTAARSHFYRQPVTSFLLLSPLAFDSSVAGIYWTLTQGGTLVLPADEALGDIPGLCRLLSSWRISHLLGIPSLYAAILEYAQAPQLASLQTVIVAGEACPARVVEDHRRRVGHAEMFNEYGPTEGTVWSTVYRCDSLPARMRVTIGRPIANTQVYLLDAYLQPVPLGVPAELHVAGAGVARGYLNQPELTAEKFISAPLIDVSDTRLYKTGDLARYLPDGNIELLGRTDQQVKIRGFRVELAEVEAVLLQYAAVRDAVVTVREDEEGNRRLFGYVSVTPALPFAVQELQRFLAEKLPAYALPSELEVLESLPRLPNGKVDRAALTSRRTLRPSMATRSDGTLSESSQPVNLLEWELIRIWERLFGRQGIGRQDNFFALGGHSLLAARLAAEVDNLLGCKLPIAALFQAPTVESLTRRLTEENWAPQWSSLVPLQPLGSKPPIFFVHGQGGEVYGFLGLAQRLAPDQPAYGLQAVGSDGKSARHITVEDMAAHYVQEIRSFQPEGPYYLGGYSMGGLIAFEVAQQLQRRGQRVALLALLDTEPIAVPWAVYGRFMASYLRDRCLFHLRRWWEMPQRDRLSYLRGRWAALRYWIARNRSKPPAVTAPPKEDSQPPQVPGFDDYYSAVASAYRLRRYPGSVDVFVCADAGWAVSSWRYLAGGGVSFHPVPETHLQIFAPHYVPALAKALRTALQRAQENARPTAEADLSHASVDS